MSQAEVENKANVYEISQADMPVSCPTKDTETWDLHPKVYLEMDKSGQATCQYCGNVFVLGK